MNRRTFAFIALAGAAPVAACTGAGGTGLAGFAGSATSAGVLEVAQANGSSAFVRAVESAGLEDELSGSGPYTLFVPTDAAFRAAGISPRGDGEALRRLVGYHVVPGQVGTGFMRGMEVNHLTSAGETIGIDGREETIRVDSARIVRQDIEARNGVVHVVDRVLGAGW